MNLHPSTAFRSQAIALATVLSVTPSCDPDAALNIHVLSTTEGSQGVKRGAFNLVGKCRLISVLVVARLLSHRRQGRFVTFDARIAPSAVTGADDQCFCMI